MEAKNIARASSVPPASGSLPPPPDELVGQEINGKYRVVEVLATGGMGRVYRAEQIPLGRMVAVKVLLPTITGAGLASDTARMFRQRFLREASVLSKLQNPYTVALFDYGRIESPRGDRERFFMAMELLEGETLQHRIDAGGKLPVSKARAFVQQLALGLRAAHALGVVHRDLKPSNIMIVQGVEDEQVKLLDFGVTKVMNEATSDATEEGVLIGSPRFMAPEQVVGEPVDARTDIYALGILAFMMLTGAPPFQCDTVVATMMAHVNQPFSADKLPADVPPPVRRLVERCMQKAPADRFQTVDELLAALRDEATGPEPARSAADAPMQTTLVDQRATYAARPHPRRWAALLGAVAVTASSAALLLARAGREAAPQAAASSAMASLLAPSTASSAAAPAPSASASPSPSAPVPASTGSSDHPAEAPPSAAAAAPAPRPSTGNPARSRPIERAASPGRPASRPASPAAASAAPAVSSTASPAPARSVDPYGERL